MTDETIPRVGAAEPEEPQAEAQSEPACRFPTKQELLDGHEPPEQRVVRFSELGMQFLLRKIPDITDLREIAEQAEMLGKMNLKDAEGNDYTPDELLAYRLALLSAALVEPKLNARECLEIGRRYGTMMNRLAGEAMLLNGLAEAEVEVRKNG